MVLMVLVMLMVVLMTMMMALAMVMDAPPGLDEPRARFGGRLGAPGERAGASERPVRVRTP
eukprot:2027739-Pyramimonas_sp.AAC.1